MLGKVFVLALVATAALGARILEQPSFCDNGWMQSDRAVQGDELMTFSIALPQSNLDKLERIALAVSDPKSPEYGQHLTSAQVNELTAPRRAHVHMVRR